MFNENVISLINNIEYRIAHIFATFLSQSKLMLGNYVQSQY